MNCTTCGKNVTKEEKCFQCKKPFCQFSCLQDHGISHLLDSEASTDYKSDSPIKNNFGNPLNAVLSNFGKLIAQPSENKPVYRDENPVKNSKESNQSASANKVHLLMTKGVFKDSLSTSNSYSYKNFDYVKHGSKNQLLGSGAFGDVFLAIHRVENRKYAIKVMNKEKLAKNNVSNSFIRKEIEIHSKLEHPYIINLKCFHENSEAFYMVMDYAKNGTLYTKIKKMKNGFSEESAFKYFMQTTSAIYFLQKNGYVHRDIKPENLLLDENNNIKLSDFGWCSNFREKKFTDTCGTYEYMAPEIIKNEKYGEKVDNWALGILLYELIHGKTPFIMGDVYKDDSNTKLLFKKILNGEYKLKNEISESLKSLIKSKFLLINIKVY